MTETTTIHALSPELIQTIAAGEVMDSWEAVLRELIDNALDAQASQIQIALWPRLCRLEVSDNGLGMSWADLQACCLAHCSSKTALSATLAGRPTLGFRGEALHSLVQVAQVTITSRIESESGWSVRYGSNGEVVQAIPLARGRGTAIRVEHLFQAWPQRQPLSQVQSLQRVIYEAALCHPHVTWQVWQNDRLWFQLGAGQTAADLLLQMISGLHAGDLQTYQATELEIVAGLPDRYHRRRPDWIVLAVNGRCVRLKGEAGASLHNTLTQAWQQSLPRHRFPLCFAHLHISPAELDWHCHPGKLEVYLHDPQAWQSKLKTALEQLWRLDPIPNQSQQHSESAPVLSGLRVATPGGSYGRGLELLDRQTQTQAEAQEKLTIVGQVHQTYILVEHPTGLWLVEQHIAHERVLYEQLLADWALTPLEPPVTLSQLQPQQVEHLTQLGLMPEPFGPDVWLIRQAPQLLSQRSDLIAALTELSLTDTLQAAQVVTACRSAIRNGTPLGLEQMQTLIAQWQRTQNPRTCPHGRPICLRLTESSLARFFRRHWVIGKSHGI